MPSPVLLHRLADDRQLDLARTIAPRPTPRRRRTRLAARERIGWSLIGLGAHLVLNGRRPAGKAYGSPDRGAELPPDYRRRHVRPGLP